VGFIVVYRGAGTGSGWDELSTLSDAVHLVEQLRNDRGVTEARIFRADEVPFDFRPYFRVEIDAVSSGLPKPTRVRTDRVAAPDDAASVDLPGSASNADAGRSGPRGLFGR